MKRYLVLLVSVVVSSLMMAGNVTPEQAEQAAQQFLNRHRLTLTPQRAQRLKMVHHRLTSRRAGAPTAYYVFNVGEKDGFVMVSGDDRTVPILGYADTGSFDADNMPENMKAWLQGYADQMAYLDSHPETPVATNTLRRTQNVIKPMIQTRWGQGAPYNLFCPMIDNIRGVTGCVATAMAQMLYYYQYPSQTTMAIPAYTTATKSIGIEEIPVTTIPWGDMQKSYTGQETAAQREAVAKLMQFCGSSVNMDYKADVSSGRAADVLNALKTYFDYDAAMTYVDRGKYRAADWDVLIYGELVKNRPVLYAGLTVSSGHAFIIDGYDGEGLYHVNWGWEGMSDNYFVLSILDPNNTTGAGASSTSDGYSISQNALIGMQPNTGVVPPKTVVMTTEYIYAPTTTITAADNEFSFSFTASFYNYTGETHTIDWGVGVYDMQGTLVDDVQLGSISFDKNYGYKDMPCTLSIPSSWSGTYKVVMISREHGSEEWLKNIDSEFNYLEATINGNTLTLRNPTMSPTAEMTVSGQLEVGGNVQTSTKITNMGSFFNQIFFLRCGGKDVGGRYLDLDSQESGTIDIPFSPAEPGTKTIELGYKTYTKNETTKQSEETFHVVASKTVTIAAAKSYTLSFSGGVVTNASDKNINDNKASLSFTVKNTGSNTYGSDLKVYSLKSKNDGTGLVYTQMVQTVPLTLEGGKSTQVNCDMPLTSDGTYWFIVTYKTNGAYIDLNDNRVYEALNGYVVTIPAEEPAGIKTVNTPSASDSQRIYTIGGIQLTPQQFEHAPKGLYIVNGRVVTK